MLDKIFSDIAKSLAIKGAEAAAKSYDGRKDRKREEKLAAEHQAYKSSLSPQALAQVEAEEAAAQIQADKEYRKFEKRENFVNDSFQLGCALFFGIPLLFVLWIVVSVLIDVFFA